MEKYRNSKKSVDRVIGKQKTDLPIIEVAQRFKSLRADGQPLRAYSARS
jgi:hypothetical protein